MNSDYVAWNGERYVWPPPDGWYLASDGRWWAADTGPEMEGWADGDLASSPDAVDNTDPTVPMTSPSASIAGHPGDHIEIQEQAPDGIDRPPPSPTADNIGSTTPPSHFDDGAPGPTSPGDNPAAGATGPVDHRYETGQSPAIPTVDKHPMSPVDTRYPNVEIDEHRSAPSHNPTTSESPRILAEADVPRAKINRPKSLPLVAAGLLVVAALALAALLAFVGGDEDDEAQQPSASLQPSDEQAELVVTTPSSEDAMSGDAMEDGAMEDGAMEDGAMEEDAMDDDAMVEEESTDATSTTVTAETGSDDAVRIGQFRTLLEDNQITAAELTGDDLAAFGVTSCSYAQASGDLTEYQEIRSGVLEGAQNEELTVDELRFIIDSAVTVFCPDDAERLGITAEAG